MVSQDGSAKCWPGGPEWTTWPDGDIDFLRAQKPHAIKLWNVLEKARETKISMQKTRDLMENAIEAANDLLSNASEALCFSKEAFLDASVVEKQYAHFLRENYGYEYLQPGEDYGALFGRPYKEKGILY